MKITANKVKVGDYINLDLGYGPNENYTFCKVLKIDSQNDLFGNGPFIHFKAQNHEEIINTIGYKDLEIVEIKRFKTKYKRRKKLATRENFDYCI